MHIKAFRVQNFRRLKSVRVDLEDDRTIFVGANNSGKTPATHLFQMFLGQQPRAPFQIYDFTADCWQSFNSFDTDSGDAARDLPQIIFDLWFDVDDDNLHRVLDLLPGLDWNGEAVGLRMVYAPRDGETRVANYKEARTKAEVESGRGESSYMPWPQTMVEYPTRRLQLEYEIKYFTLDATLQQGTRSQRREHSILPRHAHKRHVKGDRLDWSDIARRRRSVSGISGASETVGASLAVSVLPKRGKRRSISQ